MSTFWIGFEKQAGLGNLLSRKGAQVAAGEVAKETAKKAPNILTRAAQRGKDLTGGALVGAGLGAVGAATAMGAKENNQQQRGW